MTTRTQPPTSPAPPVKESSKAVDARPPLMSLESAIFKDVQVALHAGLGEAELSVAELLDLRDGSIVKLGVKLDDLIELRLNGALVARGEIVAVGDNFGVRIVEVAKLS